ncbi:MULTISPECIES: hypothetical protein [Bacillus]|uniref:hypothetical protein n=1 Tax=Bacillus TaxID=1386 RepID=UPI000306668A|nr:MULTISPECIES: hypothetical protein [Bacillus]
MRGRVLSRLKNLEKTKINSSYLPVFFTDNRKAIEEYKHLIGPKTVVIIDDIL